MTISAEISTIEEVLCEGYTDAELPFLLDQDLTGQSELSKQCAVIAKAMLKETGCVGAEFDPIDNAEHCTNPASSSAVHILRGALQFEVAAGYSKGITG